MCASLLEMICGKDHQIIAGHACPAECVGLARHAREYKPAIATFWIDLFG
jgi:hypothetical protein